MVKSSGSEVGSTSRCFLALESASRLAALGLGLAICAVLGRWPRSVERMWPFIERTWLGA